MKRAGLACMIFVFVLQSGPAQAKGLELDYAVLEGPGVEPSLDVSREEFGIVRSESSPTAIALRRFFGHKSEAPSTGSLGPGFDLTYHLNVGLAPDVTRRVVHLALYPYAENGPVMFVPMGQGPVDDIDEIESGWAAFPPALVRNLERAGMPSGSAARDAISSPSLWVILAVVLLSAATLGAGFTRGAARVVWAAPRTSASPRPCCRSSS